MEAERGGFSRVEFRKLPAELESCLNCLPQADLAKLQALLIVHEFLPP